MPGLAGEVHAYRSELRIFSHVLGELTVAVHPGAQGQGLGRQLFVRLLDVVRREHPDVTRVELITQESNHRALRLYEGVGFQREGRLAGASAIPMERSTRTFRSHGSGEANLLRAARRRSGPGSRRIISPPTSSWWASTRRTRARSASPGPKSVDQALCFGWIDGVRRRIDEVSYTIRFTPRRARSIWSTVNIKRVAVLTEQGLMSPAGLAAFERRSEERVQHLRL